MDMNGYDMTGIDGNMPWGSISDVKFEMVGTTNTAVAIKARSSGLMIKGVAIQMTGDLGIGIEVMNGISATDRNVGTVIDNCMIASGNFGVYVHDTTASTKILNSYFHGATGGTAKIKLQGVYNQVINVTSNRLMESGGISDVSTGSVIWGFNYVSGGSRTWYYIIKQFSGSLTDGAPTDAQIDAITELTPATATAGYRLTIKDSDGTGLLYLVESDGSAWFYVVMTQAVNP